jgi:hypothetical protein
MAKEKSKKGDEGFFIPGGLLIGLGAGFLFNNIPAGLFIGLGAGFVVAGIVRNSRKG